MQTHQSCSDGTVLMNSEVSYSNPLTSLHDTVSFIVISPARNPDKVSLVTLYISHWLGRNRYDHYYSTKFILVWSLAQNFFLAKVCRITYDKVE